MNALVQAPSQTEPIQSAAQLVKENYKGKVHPDWCPGCGDFSVLTALQTALFELGLKPRFAFGPLRVAVTGSAVSPPLFESLALLGREATLARLRAAL